ncbi:hypothetical protein [Larkinella punicea]|nr:hypothetical protein [Larkinella punicea]
MKTKITQKGTEAKGEAAPASRRLSFLIAIAFLSMVFPNQTQAQQNKDFLLSKNQFRVGLGATYSKTVDFQYSPTTFQSVRTNVQLGYSNRLKKGIFFTNLNVFLGSLTPVSGPDLDFYIQETDIHGSETAELNQLALSQLGFNLEIGYLHKLSKPVTPKTTLYLGGSLEENFTFTPGFLNIGTINYGSLNAKARLDYLLWNGKPLSFGLSVPLVSLVTRMPYHNSPNIPGRSGLAGFFMDNNHIETLNHFQDFRFSVKYHWLVSKKFTTDIAYQALWVHYYKPEHLTQAGSQLTLGFTF